MAQPSCWASCFGLAGPPPDAAFSHAHGQAQAHGGQPPMQYGPPPQVGGRAAGSAQTRAASVRDLQCQSTKEIA